MTPQEFEYIAQRLRPKMMAVAMDFFHSKEDAEDAVQDVLLKMWKRKWKPNDDVDALAIKATKNICVSMWRMQRLRKTDDMDETAYDKRGDVRTDSALLFQDQLHNIEQAILHLPRSEQRLIRMKLEADIDAYEISVITGIPVQSVRTMVSSARNKLLKLLNL